MPTDSTLTTILFILPSLFGLTLIGEGVQKVMNYDNRGWITVSLGGVFLVLIVLGYFIYSTSQLA